MSPNIFSRYIPVLLTALIITGCGGGSSGGKTVTPTNVTGKFVDATVVGIAYKCGGSTTISGTTNASGEYTCQTGQSVAFYVGDILIGSVSSPLAVVTPLDLVGAGATPAHTTVANIVRFLMSISSTNPATGTITIDPAVVTAATGQMADFTANTATALDALIAAVKPGATVYTSAQATTHVTASINGLFAGNYTGTFSGAASGSWKFEIDASGAVTGTYTDAVNGNGTVTGNMATTISTGSTYAFTGDAGGNAWTGTLNVSTKVFSGTWGTAPTNGTFTGAAATPPVGVTTCVSSHYSVPVHAPTATELAVYAKTYTGNVGNFGSNIGDPFVATGSASFVLSAAGGLTYNGATKLITSMCLENTPTTGAPLYVEMQPSDTVDFFADGGFTGTIASVANFNVVQGGSCATTAGCGTGGTSGTTPTITGFSPNTGAVGATVTITGTNLGLGFPPAPIVKFGTTATSAPVLTGQTSLTVTVPAGLAAGVHTITIGGLSGTPMTVGTFTVTAAGGTGTGLTVAPAFNGLLTFADSVPAVSQITPSLGTAQFQYLRTSTTPAVAAQGAKDTFEILHITTATATTISIQLSVGTLISINGSPAVSYAILNSGSCTLTGIVASMAYPQCSGIAFDKAAGTLTLTNATFTHIATGSTHTMIGSLTFTPF